MNSKKKRFYVDTSIWRDYFEDRGNGVRPLGMFAFRFLKYCAENNFEILYSSFVVEELLTYYSKDRVKIVFEHYKEHMVKVEGTEEISKKAVEISKEFSVPLVDAMHALLAKANNAVLISRDIHFEEIGHIAEIKLPEDFI